MWQSRQSSRENMQPSRSQTSVSPKAFRWYGMAVARKKYEVLPSEKSAHYGGRVMRRSRKVKEHQGVWERNRLVVPSSDFPETETGTMTRKNKQVQGDPLPLPHQAKGSSLKERNEWRQVHVWVGGQTPSLPTLHSQVGIPRCLCLTGMRLCMWKASQ